MVHTLRGLPQSIDPNHNRYWWYRLQSTNYAPLPFRLLSDQEWQLMESWFQDTERKFSSPGEMAIPAISMIQALIAGNGIKKIVQCGHYAGYSTLLLGFLLRQMLKVNALFSIDIDKEITQYTQGFIDRADLKKQVCLQIGDSADPSMVVAAESYHVGQPELVVIDSSHQYAHTLKELDLWWKALRPGGIIILHDISRIAASYDSTGQGGVNRALREWTAKAAVKYLALNEFAEGQPLDEFVYKDGCGLGIIQKPW